MNPSLVILIISLTCYYQTTLGDESTADDQTTTTGHCKAILPDGRIQTVVYTCSPSGYKAVVQYQKPVISGTGNETNDSDNTTSSVQQSAKLTLDSFSNQQHPPTSASESQQSDKPILVSIGKKDQPFESISRHRLMRVSRRRLSIPALPSTTINSVIDSTFQPDRPIRRQLPKREK